MKYSTLRIRPWTNHILLLKLNLALRNYFLVVVFLGGRGSNRGNKSVRISLKSTWRIFDSYSSIKDYTSTSEHCQKSQSTPQLSNWYYWKRGLDHYSNKRVIVLTYIETLLVTCFPRYCCHHRLHGFADKTCREKKIIVYIHRHVWNRIRVKHLFMDLSLSPNNNTDTSILQTVD